MVSTQAPSDVGEDRVPVFEFDPKRRARKDLGDRPEQLERGFLLGAVLLSGLFDRPRTGRPALPGYDGPLETCDAIAALLMGKTAGRPRNAAASDADTRRRDP
jgi:hypothetical protein